MYEIYDPGDGASVTVSNTENYRYSTIIWMTESGQPHHIEKFGPIRTWIYDTEGRLARIVGGVKGEITEDVEYVCTDAEITESGIAWLGYTGEEEEDEEDEEDEEGEEGEEKEGKDKEKKTKEGENKGQTGTEKEQTAVSGRSGTVTGTGTGTVTGAGTGTGTP